jgi:hypothetical protein
MGRVHPKSFVAMQENLVVDERIPSRGLAELYEEHNG